VLLSLGGDVARLVGQQRAGRVDRLAARLEHAGDRVLGQPVDLQVGMQGAQLARDGHVAPRMTESDRRGDEERAAPAADRPAPRGRPDGPPVGARGEVVQQLVEAHRMARVGAVPDIDELDELGARRVGEGAPTVRRDELVAVALGDQQRALQPAHEVVDRLAVQAGRLHGDRQRLGRRLQGPGHGVLELLGRVRLGVAALEEELEVAAEVTCPVVAVGLGPSLVLGQLGVEGVPRALGHRRSDGERW
jgi:hypothetical protein